MLTGAKRESSEWWHCELVPRILEHFGPKSLSLHEVANPLQCCIPLLFIILKRLARSLGVMISTECWRRVELQPCGFLFEAIDVSHVAAHVRRDESYELQAQAAVVSVD